MRHSITVSSAIVAAVCASTNAAFIYATDVENFSQGMQRNGTPVDGPRSNALLALGAPQGNDTVNFVSLGMNGSLTVSFDQPFTGSAILVETTYGNAAGHPEAAEVFVGVGADWSTALYYSVGIVQNTSDGAPLSLAGANLLSGTTVYNFVRIVDRTLTLQSNASTDGFDVDGIGVTPIPAPAAAVAFGFAGLVGLRRRR